MRGLGLRYLATVSRLLLLAAVVGIDAMAAEVENIVRNGDFEDGKIEWALRQSEGAAAEIKEDKKEAVKGDLCVFIEIANVAGTNAWHLSLFQEGHEIEKGEKYTLAFWGKAEETRPVALYVEQAADPWDEYGRESFEVNEEWQEFWITFTATLSGPVWPRIALGESDVNIWVDNVRFFTGDYVEDDEPELQKAVDPAGKSAITWAEMKNFH